MTKNCNKPRQRPIFVFSGWGIIILQVLVGCASSSERAVDFAPGRVSNAIQPSIEDRDMQFLREVVGHGLALDGSEMYCQSRDKQFLPRDGLLNRIQQNTNREVPQTAQHVIHEYALYTAKNRDRAYIIEQKELDIACLDSMDAIIHELIEYADEVRLGERTSSVLDVDEAGRLADQMRATADLSPVIRERLPQAYELVLSSAAATGTLQSRPSAVRTIHTSPPNQPTTENPPTSNLNNESIYFDIDDDQLNQKIERMRKARRLGQI